MSNSKDTNRGGIDFSGALTIAFIVLKLVGVIEWSWLWVLSPIWISLVIKACLETATGCEKFESREREE